MRFLFLGCLVLLLVAASAKTLRAPDSDIRLSPSILARRGFHELPADDAKHYGIAHEILWDQGRGLERMKNHHENLLASVEGGAHKQYNMLSNEADRRQFWGMYKHKADAAKKEYADYEEHYMQQMGKAEHQGRANREARKSMLDRSRAIGEWERNHRSRYEGKPKLEERPSVHPEALEKVLERINKEGKTSRGRHKKADIDRSKSTPEPQPVSKPKGEQKVKEEGTAASKRKLRSKNPPDEGAREKLDFANRKKPKTEDVGQEKSKTPEEGPEQFKTPKERRKSKTPEQDPKALLQKASSAPVERPSTSPTLSFEKGQRTPRKRKDGTSSGEPEMTKPKEAEPKKDEPSPASKRPSSDVGESGDARLELKLQKSASDIPKGPPTPPAPPSHPSAAFRGEQQAKASMSRDESQPALSKSHSARPPDKPPLELTDEERARQQQHIAEDMGLRPRPRALPQRQVMPEDTKLTSQLLPELTNKQVSEDKTEVKFSKDPMPEPKPKDQE